MKIEWRTDERTTSIYWDLIIDKTHSGFITFAKDNPSIGYALTVYFYDGAIGFDLPSVYPTLQEAQKQLIGVFV